MIITIVSIAILFLVMSIITNMNVLYESETEQNDSNKRDVPKASHPSVQDNGRLRRREDNENQGSESIGERTVEGNNDTVVSDDSGLEPLIDVVERTILRFRKERSFYGHGPDLRNTDVWALRNRLVEAIRTELGKHEAEYITTLEQELQEARADVSYLRMQVDMDENDLYDELDRAYATIILLLQGWDKGHAEFSDSDFTNVDGKVVDIKHTDEKTILQLNDKG